MGEDEAPDAPGDGPGREEDFGASVKRFVTIFLFILALFVIFDQNLRGAMGDAAGFVLSPLFAFDHRLPVFTFFPTAIVMVLITSVLRHVMMDWKEVARSQHVISHLNKELFRATKDENKYKIKKLNEIKESPEFVELQSKQMGSTWRVMGPTMIIAVAIFAWMFSFAAAPVGFDVGAPDDSLVVAWDSALLDVGTAGDDVPIRVGQGADLFVFTRGDPGPVSAVRDYDGVEFQGTSRTLNLSSARTVELDPGRYTVETSLDGTNLNAGGSTLRFAAFVVEDPSGLRAGKIWPDGDQVEKLQTITVDEDDTVHLLLPVRATPGGGTFRVVFTPRTAGSSTTVDLDADDTLPLPRPTTHVISKEGHVPWTRFNLNGTTLLPNWILLYSLFTIPFGYLFQKLFKAWEYRGQLDEADAPLE